MRLGVTQANEDAEAQDHVFIAEAWVSKRIELLEQGLCYWPEAEIPDAVFQHIVTLMANEVGPEFGRPASADVEEEMLRRLRSHVAKRPSGEPVWFPEF